MTPSTLTTPLPSLPRTLVCLSYHVAPALPPWVTGSRSNFLPCRLEAPAPCAPRKAWQADQEKSPQAKVMIVTCCRAPPPRHGLRQKWHPLHPTSPPTNPTTFSPTVLTGPNDNPNTGSLKKKTFPLPKYIAPQSSTCLAIITLAATAFLREGKKINKPTLNHLDCNR